MMALESGFNRLVRIERRTAKAERTWSEVSASVPCRIVSHQATEAQALSEQFSRVVTHKLLTGADEDLREGDRVTVTDERATGGSWASVTNGQTLYVVQVEQAHGSTSGPRFVRAQMSTGTATA